MYGRASTLFPRTLEFVDQLGLIDEFTQMGLVARGSVNFKDGKRVTSRGWNSIFQQMGETYHNYSLNIRLKHSERLIQNAYEKLGGRVATRWELRDLSWGEADEKGYRVSATVGVVGSSVTKVVRR
jgi:phenol 2-monooxygenase